MTWEVTLAVLAAALMHALWNALLKSCPDRLAMQVLVVGIPALACLPFLSLVPLPGAEAWFFLALSTVVHGLYYLTLAYSYRHGDLSQVYPIARGSAPLMIAFGAWAFAGEAMNAVQWLGMFVLSAGIASLSELKKGPLRAEAKALLFALATGTSIALYSLADGLGVRLAPVALSYVLWLIVLEAIPMLAIGLWLMRGRVIAGLAPHLGKGVIGGACLGLGYGIVIWAMGQAPIAQVSALRETSVIIAALIGFFWLREGLSWRRLMAAGLVCAGNAILRMG